MAFSRVTQDKVYVQHKMMQGDMPSRIWSLLSKGGYIYICGDAKNMAHDVHVALVRIVAEHGQKGDKEAEEYIHKMQSSTPSRFQSDVWS